MALPSGPFSDLPVLRIRLEIVGEGEVVCSLEGRGLDSPSWRASTSELGLPQRFDRRLERSGGYSFQMPAWAIDEIGKRLARGAPGEPLWLRLERPSGYLGAVPWERLLQPALGVPVLRLPEVESGLPRETPGTLDVLLCASAPVAKEHFEVAHHLAEIVERIIARVPRKVRIHVFTDLELQDALPSQWSRGAFPAGGPVHIHDPHGAADFEIPEVRERLAEVQTRLQSPWLLWMQRALNGRSVDVVHFLCHGYLAFDRGALCFAESPLQNQDRRSARFVGVGELNTFLTQVGAWSTAFSSPERNDSEIGLRLLADSVAQTLPGPLLVHDLPLDPGCGALGEAYRCLYTPYPTRAPASPALSIQCQPSRVEQEPPTRGGLGAATRGSRDASLSVPGSFAEAVEIDPLAEVFSSTENVPAWVAAATRYVEQKSVRLQESAAAVAFSPESVQPESQGSDPVAETLRQIQEIIADEAAKRSGGGS